ncbi:hypothetical protein BDN72DRAFT_141985 [Pluteus cervinus]|uniref:Uncharacterized protein n=1 Tax=Pluteus cervinus TaxID=181527 RepID=A0ACD3AMY0_9AGAR|nr:hypothetical protein BDN72DRAFT_141985 [Pluteus cervinus]
MILLSPIGSSGEAPIRPQSDLLLFGVVLTLQYVRGETRESEEACIASVVHSPAAITALVGIPRSSCPFSVSDITEPFPPGGTFIIWDRSSHPVSSFVSSLPGSLVCYYHGGVVERGFPLLDLPMPNYL